MRIVVVGATGVVGGAVHRLLSQEHDVIAASRHGEHQVDMQSPDSIASFFASLGTIDALVAAAGHAPSVELTEATGEHFAQGFANKLAGQIGLALGAIPHLTDGGSITLTTGILNREPVPGTAVAATVNGGLEAFVQAAATELPRGIRINAVSANVLEETKQAAGPSFFVGYQPVPADRVALAYQKSIANRHTGRIYGVWQ